MNDHPEQLSFLLNNYKQQYLEFIEMASHDLQAPLRKLVTLTERLTSKYPAADNAEAQQYVTRIMACVQDMRSLVDGLSELAAVTPGMMEYTGCDLNSLVKKVLGGLEPDIKEKHAEITMTTLPTIECDANQCRQLFKKLLENGLRFSRVNIPPLISVENPDLLEEERERFDLRGDQPYCKITITDNGIGFGQQWAEKIFQPFVRLNGKSAFGGNGLGLAICDKIVSNHKGVLYAESPANRGARFIIILPEKS